MAVLSKSQMSEEDIKFHYITPAITAKWNNQHITLETKITDGRINLKGNIVAREKPKRADYVLYLSANNPIAIVEAKDNNHTVSHGLQQAMTYAQMLDVPFAFSSNGDGFAEHDFLTGKERTFGLDEFPTEEELVERYKASVNNGAGLTDVQEKMIAQPYYSSQKTYPPRYYQRIAINRTLDAIAKGQNRLLLVMATGTGKTYTAFQIVYRLLKSGLKKKILYLADRNNLVDQSIQQDFAPLEKVIHKVNFSKDDPRTITSYEVYFSLYQQLAGKNEEQDENAENALDKLSQLFSPDFFDLIIVDECHRGSAKKESNWRKILEYFSSATQIGMTATPKETKYVSNIDYFGEPIYTYSLKEGIEDGFLAPFKVINVMTDIGEGWRPRKGQRDIYGNEIEDRIYTNSDYDYNIIIEDRINQVAAEITRYLKSTDRMAKTIVFCPTEEAAERMRMALANQNADMVKQNPDYVVRITGSDTYSFDAACQQLNREYQKNKNKNEIKSHHYIISFDPRDSTENCLTGKRAQELGLEYAKANFPGHQALVCTHMDGHNGSGNIHVHIVINSLRKLDVPQQPFMERPIDCKAGYKHHVTNEYLKHLQKSLMDLCRCEFLHQVDLLSPSRMGVTEAEYWAQRRLDEKKQEIEKEGFTPNSTKFQTQKQLIRDAVATAGERAISYEDFQNILQDEYDVFVKTQRGRYSYLPPERNKFISERSLGDSCKRECLEGFFVQNAEKNLRYKEDPILIFMTRTSVLTY